MRIQGIQLVLVLLTGIPSGKTPVNDERHRAEEREKIWIIGVKHPFFMKNRSFIANPYSFKPRLTISKPSRIGFTALSPFSPHPLEFAEIISARCSIL